MSIDGDAAELVGEEFAKAGRPVTDCPYDTNGAPDQLALAVRFVQGYRDAKPATDTDFTGDE